MIINVTVSTRASLNEVKKISDGIYRIKTTAVPEKGLANAKIIELLSKELKTAKSHISLIAGATCKNKLFKIE